MKKNARSFKDAIADVHKTLQTLEEANQELSKGCSILQRQLSELPIMPIGPEDRQKLIRDYINALFSQKAKERSDHWAKPSRLQAPPPFVSIGDRPRKNGLSTRFISFINFKGGVGKTTLVANIAAAFASGRYQTRDQSNSGKLKVLMVDLDFQGTLSDRCVDQQELQQAIERNLTSTLLLAKPSNLSQQIRDLSLSVVGCPNASIIAANDSLDPKDTELFVKYILEAYDTRYYFRYWFHQPEVLNNYDLVIFDCPPRRTGSAICALAVSDYMFLPTSPDLFDQLTVYRTLTWAQTFFNAIQSPCKLGGVILNRTNNANGLTSNERNYSSRLNESISHKLSTLLDEEPYVLNSFVPKRVDINGDRDSPLPGSTGQFKFLNQLASEIYEKVFL